MSHKNARVYDFRRVGRTKWKFYAALIPVFIYGDKNVRIKTIREIF